MAKTLSDQVVTEVEVTEAEFLALLSQKAQDAGLINYAPDTIEINRWSIASQVPNEPDQPGWKLTFTGPRPA